MPSRIDAVEIVPVDVGGALHQHRARTAGLLGHFLEALRVRRIGRANHDHGIDDRRHALDRILAVGRRVADVFLVRAGDVREALLQQIDHGRGVVHRQRRLRHIGELVGIARREFFHIVQRLDQRDAAGRQLPHGADDFRMAGVADQHDLAAAPVVNLGLAMHLGHQRAGRVDREQIAPRRLLGDRARHAVRGEDHRRVVIGNLAEFLDEDRALGAQALDHIAVVHDLVAHIDRRPVNRERPLHQFDGAHDAGAEAARRAEQHLEDWALANLTPFINLESARF